MTQPTEKTTKKTAQPNQTQELQDLDLKGEQAVRGGLPSTFTPTGSIQIDVG